MVERFRNEIVSVGAASSQISLPLYGFGRRKLFVIRHTDSTGGPITLGFGKEAIANAGIVLNYGDMWVEGSENGFQCAQVEITAISNTGGTYSVSVHERVE